MALSDDYSYSPSPQVMGAVQQIESGGNPNASTGSYKGLYQLSQGEFDRYGGKGSIYDPGENSRVAGLKIRDEGNQLAKALGRPVTDAEVYLAHQQGVGGATSHLSNPNQPAWKSMLDTAEGRQKGEAWAKKAIWGNIPDAQKAQFGNVDNVTSGQFTGLWGQRFARAMGQPQQVASAASAAPTAPAVPQQRAPIFANPQSSLNVNNNAVSQQSGPAYQPYQDQFLTPSQPIFAPAPAPLSLPTAQPVDLSGLGQAPAMPALPGARPVDLSGLRQALATRAPIFSNLGNTTYG